MRTVLASAAMAAVVMAGVFACGCTIERVVLYETVNYPAVPAPERTPAFSLNFPAAP